MKTELQPSSAAASRGIQGVRPRPRLPDGGRPHPDREAGEIRSGRSRASYRCIYRTKPYGIRTRFRI